MNKIFKTAIFTVAIMLSVNFAFGQHNTANPMEECRDKVDVTVTDLAGLPPNGVIIVHFINPDPTVSCSITRNFYEEFDETIRGNYNRENWSEVTVTVILGNREYIATYSSPYQWIPVVFHGYDFTPTLTAEEANVGDLPPNTTD